MPEHPDNLPGNGFLGWLGRQVGHVAKAINTDVDPKPAAPPSKIVYRECTIEEKESPVDPNVKLRRTIIDEVVEQKKIDGDPTQKNQPQMNTDEHR